MEKRELPKSVIVFTAENLILSPIDHQVVIALQGIEQQIGLAPGIGMAIRLTPKQARQFADALSRMADKAEEGLPRA